MRLRLLLIPALALLFLAGKKNETNPTVKILASMYDSISNVRTIRMKVSAIERVEKRYLSARSEIKVLVKPRKVYFINRARKLEILYDSQVDPDKALVRYNVFPQVPLMLDPKGALMRKNQHYTLHELGFEFIGKSIALTISKDKDAISNFKYHGITTKNGEPCYMLEYENSNYGFIDYRVGEKETVTSIALRLCVNDYLLRYRNDLLNDFGFLKKGRMLKVPNLFCKRAVIYINQRLMLPVSISLYDDKGLFECYDFTNVVINKPFSSSEFSRENPDYGF